MILDLLPGSLAFINSLLVAFLVFFLGFMIMSTLFPKMILRERMLMAYPASFLSVYALFFINFISGGKVFSNSIIMVAYFSALSLLFFAKIISKKRMKETAQFLRKRITLIVLLSCG